jgi:hypothetical protein
LHVCSFLALQLQPIPKIYIFWGAKKDVKRAKCKMQKIKIDISTPNWFGLAFYTCTQCFFKELFKDF